MYRNRSFGLPKGNSSLSHIPSETKVSRPSAMIAWQSSGLSRTVREAIFDRRSAAARARSSAGAVMIDASISMSQ